MARRDEIFAGASLVASTLVDVACCLLTYVRSRQYNESLLNGHPSGSTCASSGGGGREVLGDTQYESTGGLNILKVVAFPLHQLRAAFSAARLLGNWATFGFFALSMSPPAKQNPR